MSPLGQRRDETARAVHEALRAQGRPLFEKRHDRIVADEDENRSAVSEHVGRRAGGRPARPPLDGKSEEREIVPKMARKAAVPDDAEPGYSVASIRSSHRTVSSERVALLSEWAPHCNTNPGSAQLAGRCAGQRAASAGCRDRDRGWRGWRLCPRERGGEDVQHVELPGALAVMVETPCRADPSDKLLARPVRRRCRRSSSSWFRGPIMFENTAS